MRASSGHAFWWHSLFTVFWLQGTILWFVALPLLVSVRATQPRELTVVDGLGVLVFAGGFVFEVVGDHQLKRFKAESRKPRQSACSRAVALHAASKLFRRRPDLVGHVLPGGFGATWMVHGAEPVPHDAVAAARVRRDAARGRLEGLEARLSRVHHPNAGVLPMVSTPATVSPLMPHRAVRSLSRRCLSGRFDGSPVDFRYA